MLNRISCFANDPPVVELSEPVMRDETLSKSQREGGEPLPDVVAQLRLRIAALERELAAYGSRYGFTDTARTLLSRPQDF